MTKYLVSFDDGAMAFPEEDRPYGIRRAVMSPAASSGRAVEPVTE